MTLPTDVTYAAWLAQEERTRQASIVLARNYYDGLHDVRLTERQKEFLGFNSPEGWRFALNYCNTVVDAIVDRLALKAMHSGKGNETADEWAREVLKANRMDGIQDQVHIGAVRDTEYFVIVDWDAENKRPRISPHPRYTDSLVDGDGYGCKVHYSEGDPSLPALYASKRWVETHQEGGKSITKSHMNLYYPDRIEWYELQGGGDTTGWGEPVKITPWRDRQGRPLGIPVLHFVNPGDKSELWNAIPVQDAINKTALDILAVADANGWGFVVADGFMPTTDGLPPAADGSNYIKIHPGMWLVVPEGGRGVSRLAGENLTPLLALLDSLIFKLAQVTDTPITRFQVGMQVRAEGTLQQQEEPLIAKVEKRQITFGNAWEDAIQMCARLQNAFGSGTLDEDDRFESGWEPAQKRDKMADELAFWLAAEQAGKAGVPLTAFLELQNWDQEKIDKIVSNPEHAAKLAMQQMAVERFGQPQQAEEG